MASELAQTTFQAGPNDALAALDVYSQSTAAPPISNLSLKLPSSYEEMAKTIGTPAVDPTDQLSGYALANGTALTANDLTKTVIAQDAGMHSAFAQLDPILQKAITNVKGMVGVTMSNKGLKVNYNLASALNIAGMTTMVNILGGKKDIIDVLNVKGQVNFLTNVLKISAKMNIPNAYGIISANITDRGILTKVTNNLLGSVIGNCNVNMLGNIALSYRNGKFSLKMPSLCFKFANGFKLTLGLHSKKHGGLAASISSSFSFLNSKWNVGVTSNGKMVVKASVFLNASHDFKRVMSASATRSRQPLLCTRTNSPWPSTNSIPNYNTRLDVIKYEEVDKNGHMVVKYKFASGKEEHYTTDKNTGNVTQTLVTPTALTANADDYKHFDNSGIDDPMALGHVFSSFADQSKSSSKAASAINTDAGTSLKANFPYTALNGLQSLDDVSYA